MTVKAHQVLSDIERLAPYYRADPPPGVKDDFIDKTLNGLKDFIRGSIKFKFGRYDDLKGLFSKKQQDKIIYGWPGLFAGQSENLRFPFNQCYFEFHTYHPKINHALHYALLTNYHPESNSFDLAAFQKSKTHTRGIWILNKVAPTVFIGPPRPGCPSNISITHLWGLDLDIHGLTHNADGLSKLISMPLIFLTLALTVLNCNNIVARDTYPDKPLQKKRARKGKKPLFTYKTLYVMPPGKKSKSRPPQGLWTTAVNLRIGYHAYYPPPGLFGKYPGRFWFQPIAKGDASQGVTHREYDVTRMV